MYTLSQNLPAYSLTLSLSDTRAHTHVEDIDSLSPSLTLHIETQGQRCVDAAKLCGGEDSEAQTFSAGCH